MVLSMISLEWENKYSYWRVNLYFLTITVILLTVRVHSDVWMNFERTTFILAGRNDLAAEQCAKHSDYYCLSSWETAENRTRAATPYDFRELKELAEENYKLLNWYNLHNHTANEECCHYQMQQYWIQGQLRGFSPQEYIDKISDFNSNRKKLNYVVARYNSSLCVNVIYRLGYGSPTQLLSSRAGIIHADRPFIMLPGREGEEVPLIQRPFRDLRQVLNFDWFKENYICQDHPEICYDD